MDLFIAAIMGGLASYPMAAAGAMLVGVLESVGGFWASAYRDVTVFTLPIPLHVWLSLRAGSGVMHASSPPPTPSRKGRGLTVRLPLPLREGAGGRGHVASLLLILLTVSTAPFLLPAFYVTLFGYVGMAT